MTADVHPSGDDRFGLYTIRDGALVEVARTSREGIGITLTTLVGEGEYRDAVGRQRPLGIRDRKDGAWVVNPYAPGSRT